MATGCLIFGLTTAIPVHLAHADSVVDTVSVGAKPYHMVSLGDKVYVGHDTIATPVSIIDTADANSVTTVTEGLRPWYVFAFGTNVYVVSYGQDTISVIDTEDNNAVTLVEDASFDYPYAAAKVGDKIYVTNNDTNTISIIDTADSNSVTSIEIDDYPYGIVAIGTKLYVASWGSNVVSVIDTEDNNSITLVSVGDSPAAIAAYGTKVFVANTGDGTVSIIDTTDSNSVTPVSVGNMSQDSKILALGSKVVVANTVDDTISIINTADGNSVATVDVGDQPYLGAVLGSKVYVANYGDASVSVIDTSVSNSVTTLEVGVGPYVGMATLGTKVYVPNYNGSSVSVIETDTTAPTITLTGSASLSIIKGDSYTDAGATASDDVDGDITNDIVVAGSVDTTRVGTYTLTYNVSDAADNAATAVTRTVVVNGRTVTGSYPSRVRSRSLDTTPPENQYTPSAKPVPSRDVFVGMRGDDIRALQQFLNTHGFTLATEGPGSPGSETDFFGALTRAALARFQLANNIVPAVGYFGPITRGVIGGTL